MIVRSSSAVYTVVLVKPTDYKRYNFLVTAADKIKTCHLPTPLTSNNSKASLSSSMLSAWISGMSAFDLTAFGAKGLRALYMCRIFGTKLEPFVSSIQNDNVRFVTFEI